MAASGAVEAEQTGGEAAAAEDVADGGEDVGAERPHEGTVGFFATTEEGGPGGGAPLDKKTGAPRTVAGLRNFPAGGS